MTFTDEELHKEAKRELAMRRRKYPQWVESGFLDRATADRQLALQEAIVTKLAPPAPADLFSIVQERTEG